MCSALQCFKFPEDSTKCRWVKQAYADTVSLIVVNRSRTSRHLQNAANLRIENFEIRNSFRKWQSTQHNHWFNDSGSSCGTGCGWRILPLISSAGIEIWRANITIENCRLWRNSTTGYAGRGGGIFASSSNLTVNNCTFEENYGGYYGGGLFASDGAFGSCSPCCDLASFPRDSVTVTVTNNRFRNNLAEFGAGLQLGAHWCNTTSQMELKTVIQNNSITDNCSSRFGNPQHDHQDGAPAIYIPGGPNNNTRVKVLSLRSNKILRNKATDNAGAILFSSLWVQISTDSFRLNTIGGNIGGGVHVWCRQKAGGDSCTAQYPQCANEILAQMKDNIFWKNRECDTLRTGEAHVILGQARAEGQPTTGCHPSFALQNWVCNATSQSSCNSTTNWRALWCSSSCPDTTEPCVRVSNVIYKVVKDSTWVTAKSTFWEGNQAKAQFTVNWKTTAKADSLNRVKMWFPARSGCNPASTPDDVKTVFLPAAGDTLHAVTWKGNCGVGWFKFKAESLRKEGLLAVSRCDSTYVSSCPTCGPPPCHPLCELE
jgi:hypothetical protein